MAKSVNKAILLGHVGKDPELSSTNNGTLKASFSLATSDRQKDGQGNWQNKTEWHNLIAFKRTAEIVRDYVKKGSQLMVEGKIQTHSWGDKQTGQKRNRIEIFVYDLTLIGGGRGENGDSSAEGRRGGGRRGTVGSGYQTDAQEDRYADADLSSEDIPF